MKLASKLAGKQAEKVNWLWKNNFERSVGQASLSVVRVPKISSRALALLLMLCIGAGAGAPTEYQVKALFLLNFAQYVEWPADVFPSPDAPLLVGVLGDDPFGADLDNAFRGRTIAGRHVVIRRSHVLDDMTDCQIVFVSASERGRLNEIINVLRHHPILTVSEIDGFCLRGGIINFYIENDRVHFEINLSAAQNAGLRMSSQLLKRAKMVGQGG